MDRDRLEYYREKLIKEKRDVLNSINRRLIGEYGTIDTYYTELSRSDNHPGDIGTEVFMMEQDRGFRNKLGDILEEIDISLKDMEQGNYGVCKICNNYIDEERLDLIPYTKTCVDCFTKKDYPVDFRQFESIDENKIVSFSMEPSENVEFDREDSYQKVASFNMVSKDPSFSTGDNMGIMDEEDHGVVEDIEHISQEYYNETLK
ncbi:MAG: TraR/DksA C4-type zinc finger protein [Tissierellaceae bacterium]